MNCSDIREALSARIDGEAAPLPDPAVDRHVAGCPACRGWQDEAVRLRRFLVVREAPAVPDLTARILAEVPAPPSQRWGRRTALALVALLQCGLGLAGLFGVDVGHAGHTGTLATAVHLGNESTAWNLAIGLGLLWAALRPSTAAGLLPALTGFVAILGVLSGIDFAAGEVTAARVLSHGLLVAGVGLLYAVRAEHRRTPAPHPGTRAGAETDGDPGVTAPDPAHPAEQAPTRRRFPHLPAGRRAA